MLFDLYFHHNQGNAKSGYWRLFFTEMQEEANRQYEEKTGKKVAPVKVVSTKEEPQKPKAKRANIKVKEPLETKVEHKPTFKPNPFHREPVKIFPNTFDLLATLPVLEIDKYQFYQLLITRYGTIIDLNHERNKRKRHVRRRVAAFLLLAA